ncbi:transcription-repair coupling factor [uncultured Rikenella sp.]|uniref:transcription-repair coupling factor n=1 Tax=uncultured Rikenella sp. TaxID=368003 RepID=UPI00261D2921|nr:transcription-repair coupling factor [uncultured Rikenella sp.]
MTIDQLVQRIEKSEAVSELERRYPREKTLRIKGMAGSLLAIVAGIIARRKGGIHLLVAGDRDEASYLCNDLTNLNPTLATEGQILFYPTAYRRSIQTQREDPAGIVQRTAVLTALATSRGAAEKPLLICTYPEALVEKVADRERLAENILRIKKGQRIAMDELETQLTDYRFERVDFVGEPGQYSRRGGIIDIFSFGDNKPYRIDFFGDDIESIRLFNVGTQLSTETRDEIEIVPNLKNPELAEKRVSLAEYIGGGDQGEAPATLWLDNPIQLLDKLDRIRTKLLGELPDPAEIDTLVTSRKRFVAETDSWRWIALNVQAPERPAAGADIDFGASPQPQFNKNFELLAADIRRGNEEGRTTYILTENRAQMERIENVFESVGLEPVGYGHVPITLHGGFVLPALQLALYTDHQIFDRYHRYTVPNEIDRRESMTIAEFNALQVGDFVVHIDHGVGRFGGLVRSTTNGVVQEFIKLVYKDNDILFVNVHSLHRISKYKDKDAPEPKVHKLGSGAWQKLKQTTKNKVKDIARELIALYAKRKASEGYAFSPDGFLQQELEASFLYEDTPDQQSATQAVKEDMEQPVPMDRLICGDVGFGKTEIAIRAAFKAAADGKQVAVLVPTTVLSLQHYRTFSRRLRDFPVRVENFSRVKTAKQTREILDDLAAGKIDIIIGTHRLLGKNVRFKDLGLLVIDEEQKFGVANKEKLRHLKTNVDTLTLTATPIPRTLQFSLMGARDMSIINTPPPNRQPVATEVDVFDEEIIREAIETELQRGGQVFFLHNRVQTLGRMRETIERLCPGARVAVGHGQMPAVELEKIMMDFIYGEYDVLLATTIIESGIDIPNANTIIINQAHMFGLSDLHQLRGRVGRTNRKAYCYLLIPSEEAVTSDAYRRLRALEEFSDLGSGFNIAMQDLDIRGAGNILGAEQSGFIADIGFETYQKIMAEAVAELREEQGLEPDTAAIDCVIETDSSAHLPDSYIGTTAEKIRLYRELDGIGTEEALQQFIERLTDRFGEPPAPVQELFEVVRLRRVAQADGIERIVLKNGAATLYFVADEKSAFYRGDRFMTILKAVTAAPKRFKLNQSNNKLSLSVNGVRSVSALRETLEGLTAAC